MYNIKKLSELDFYPSQLCVSENAKSISVCDDKNFYVYSSLGFRKKMNGLGTNFNFIGNEEFVVLKEKSIDFYRKNDFVKCLRIDNLEKILLCDKYLYTITKDSTEVFTFDGLRIFTFNFKARKAVKIEEYLIFEFENNIKIYKISDDIISAYIEQELDIDEIGIPDSFVFLSEFNVLIESYCSSKELLLFNFKNKGYYIFLKEMPFLYCFGPVGGSICGLLDNKILLLNDKKVKYFELDLDFVEFQWKVFNGEQPDCKEKFRLRAILFYESLGKNDEALKICINDNQRFEILIKLDRLKEAYDLSSTPAMFDRVGNEFLKCSDLVNATESFYKSKNWKSLLYVDLLCNKKYLKEIAKNALERGENNLAFIALMKSSDYKKCGDLLKETKFYNFFAKTYLK